MRERERNREKQNTFKDLKIIEYHRTKQNRIEQNRTKQNRIEQNITKQNRIE